MRRPVRDFSIALGFLTVLPGNPAWPAEGPACAVAFYPWVGWLLGAAAAVLTLGVRTLAGGSIPVSLLTGALIVAGWAALTGLLHWDGLADAADGLLGQHDRARRLEIMRDSRTGAFGVAAVALVALIQVAASGAAVAVGRGAWVLVCAPVLARASAAYAAWRLPAARPDGLGRAATGRPGPYALTAVAFALCGLLVLGYLTAPRIAFFGTLGVGVLAGISVPHLLARRLGGMTGDLFGAAILLVEAAVLVAGSLAP